MCKHLYRVRPVQGRALVNTMETSKYDVPSKCRVQSTVPSTRVCAEAQHCIMLLVKMKLKIRIRLASPDYN